MFGFAHQRQQLLEAELRHDPSTYPPQEILQNLEAGLPLDGEEQQRRRELWLEVRG